MRELNPLLFMIAKIPSLDHEHQLSLINHKSLLVKIELIRRHDLFPDIFITLSSEIFFEDVIDNIIDTAQQPFYVHSETQKLLETYLLLK